VCKYCPVPNTTTTCDHLIVKLTTPSDYAGEIQWRLGDEPLPRRLTKEQSADGTYVDGTTYEFELATLPDGTYDIWLEDTAGDGWGGGAMRDVWLNAAAALTPCPFENDGECDAGTTDCAANTDLCDCGKCRRVVKGDPIDSLGLLDVLQTCASKEDGNCDAAVGGACDLLTDCVDCGDCDKALLQMTGHWEVLREDPANKQRTTIASGYGGFDSWDKSKVQFSCGIPPHCPGEVMEEAACHCKTECSFSNCVNNPRFDTLNTPFPVWLADVDCDGSEKSICESAPQAMRLYSRSYVQLVTACVCVQVSVRMDTRDLPPLGIESTPTTTRVTSSLRTTRTAGARPARRHRARHRRTTNSAITGR
jgi:hypothetical protein